jgi:tRNA pseudouridine38-40 synthase
MRLLARLEFDGTQFAGWQLQDDARSVQGEVELALKTSLRSPSRIIVNGCSRTDAGVHAREFFCNFDVDVALDGDGIERLRHSTNSLLPAEIVITQLKEIAQDFDAQRNAVSKTYQYRVLLRRAKPTIDRAFVWWISATPADLNKIAIDQCLNAIQGTHDFRSFMAAGSSAKSTVRTIHSATAKLIGEQLIFEICGNGFLKQMVRNLVGTIVETAQGKRDVSSFAPLLGAHGDRILAGLCAPPQGLSLIKVDFNA